MKKYCKVANQETKQVNVGLGDNVEFYKSIGYTIQEVEQDYKGNWYLKGYGEIESLEETKEKKLKEFHNKITSQYNEMVDKVKSCKSVKSLGKIGGVRAN